MKFQNTTTYKQNFRNTISPKSKQLLKEFKICPNNDSKDQVLKQYLKI